MIFTLIARVGDETIRQVDVPERWINSREKAEKTKAEFIAECCGEHDPEDVHVWISVKSE
jgi:hypothetical protein